MIKCRICGHECGKTISTHLARAHHISQEYYLEAYPDAEITVSEGFRETKYETCKICGKECRSLPCHLKKSHNMSLFDYNKMNGDVDESSFAVCAVCGHRAANLTRHLKNSHGITASEYQSKYHRSVYCEDYFSEEQVSKRKASMDKAREAEIANRKLHPAAPSPRHHGDSGKRHRRSNIEVYRGRLVDELRNNILGQRTNSLIAILKKMLDKKETDEKVENGELVRCAICGECHMLLSNHIKNVHGMSTDEYLELYPNTSISSQSWLKLMSDRNQSSKMVSITAERNKSDKMRMLISERNKDPEFKLKCHEGFVHWNPENKKRFSMKVSERNRENWKDSYYRNHMSQLIRKRWKDPEYAAKIFRSLDLSNKYGHHQKYYSKKFHKLFLLKSDCEKSFVEFCENFEGVTDLQYEGIPIPYIDVTGLPRTYYPDFLVYINNVPTYMVEVKWDEPCNQGTNKCKAAAAKLLCFKQGLTYCWYEKRYDENMKSLDEIIAG